MREFWKNDELHGKKGHRAGDRRINHRQHSVGARAHLFTLDRIRHVRLTTGDRISNVFHDAAPEKLLRGDRHVDPTVHLAKPTRKKSRLIIFENFDAVTPRYEKTLRTVRHSAACDRSEERSVGKWVALERGRR